MRYLGNKVCAWQRNLLILAGKNLQSLNCRNAYQSFLSTSNDWWARFPPAGFHTCIALRVRVLCVLLVFAQCRQGSCPVQRQSGWGVRKLGFSAAILWPLDTWCCSTSNDTYCGLELGHSCWSQLSAKHLQCWSSFLKQLWLRKGQSQLQKNISLAEGLAWAVSNGKTAWNMQWILNYRCPKPAEPINPPCLWFCIIRSEWFGISQRRSWTHTG